MTKQKEVLKEEPRKDNSVSRVLKDVGLTGLSMAVFLSDIVWRILIFSVVVIFLSEQGVAFTRLEDKIILLTGLLWILYGPLDRLTSFLRRKEVRDAINRR